MSVFKITPTTQAYDWGKIGRSSKVAAFAESSGVPGFQVDDGTPYAELWMGTHPSSPSRIASTGEALADYLRANPHLIGHNVTVRFQGSDRGDLPYLFKVLSINKALSIQTHPDKKTAEALHAEHPKIYKDPNHKPEMALAITPFRAMCGFRPLSEIASFLESTPEFRGMIPAPIVEQFLKNTSGSPDIDARASLKDLFAALMTASESQVKQQLEALVTRYRNLPSILPAEKKVADLVITLNSQFPGDIGVFCAFVLNEIHLQPGEAIYLGAGEPHAYVAGDCVECMANSDNVIRAGLTPKFRDVENLIKNLTYVPAPGTAHYVKAGPLPSTTSTTLYDPPIPEFSVAQVLLSPGAEESHPKIDGPSIAIVTSGRAIQVGSGQEEIQVGVGDAFFVGANTPLGFKNVGEEAATVYRAFVEAS